ncbi:MAG: hypothetical protein WDA16_10470 [Candidatus Thermoplasmatota archaeon]
MMTMLGVEEGRDVDRAHAHAEGCRQLDGPLLGKTNSRSVPWTGMTILSLA